MYNLNRLINTNALCCILILILFSGCSPLIVPTPYHVPAVEDKGDLHLNALTGISEFNLQAAYMPAERFFITSSYSTNLLKHETAGDVHHQTSLGAGYIYKRRKTQWAISGGYSWGKSRDNSTSTYNQTVSYYNTQVNYSNIYLQPYMNLLVSRNFNFYSGLRASVVSTRNFRTNTDGRKDPGNMSIVEPFVGLRAGYRALKFEMQYGIYKHKSSRINESADADDVLNTHIGIGYTFGLAKKKVK